MVTAPILDGGKGRLAQSQQRGVPQDNDALVLTISIKADKTYYWNMGSEVDVDTEQERAVNLEQMIQAGVGHHSENRRQGKQVQVFVRGDKSVDYGTGHGGHGRLAAGRCRQCRTDNRGALMQHERHAVGKLLLAL